MYNVDGKEEQEEKASVQSLLLEGTDALYF